MYAGWIAKMIPDLLMFPAFAKVNEAMGKFLYSFSNKMVNSYLWQ